MKWLNVHFDGGLGNQLFQYAAARALAMPNGRLLFDLAWYDANPLERTFGLSHFRTKGRIISNAYVKKMFTPGTRLNNVVKSLGEFHFFQEQGFHFHEGLEKQLRILSATRGYWQTEKYFKQIRPVLLSEIVPRSLPERPSFLEIPNTVAVHVRRGDYLSDRRYGFLGTTYYKDAMQIMKSKVQAPIFIVFSDDLDWCRTLFNAPDCVFADSQDWSHDYLQLYLISQCEHQVIANSSFSWWGAWLNQNEKKVVIRPAKPFTDESLLYQGHYPADWIAL